MMGDTQEYDAGRPAPSQQPLESAQPPGSPEASRSATLDTMVGSQTLEATAYADKSPASAIASHASRSTQQPDDRVEFGATSSPADQHDAAPFGSSGHRPPQESEHASLLPQAKERATQPPCHADPLHSELPRSQAHDHEATPDDHEMVLLSAHAASHAPSYSDLFFDLLFAACLNTYSNAVSLEKFGNVAAFLGYFSALWWAWWSQAYFDVRYRRPSHRHPFLFKSCQRVIRAAVLGLWVAFSTTPSEFSRGGFTNFTLICGCSRMALALDHAVVLVYDLVRWRKHPSSAHVELRRYEHEPAESPPPTSHAIPSSKAHSSNKAIAAISRTHLVSIASLVASGLLWILSRLVPRHGVTAPLLVMWIAGVALEAAGQLANELSGALSLLGDSVLPERLVLFGLIILGEGFTGIAETLNRISPGAKIQNEALGGAAIESGGWGGDTILQAISCVLIVVLQFGGYFHRATNHIDARSVWIVVWAYIHMVLHMSSALLVIGLKKILSFQNTRNAMDDFFANPTIYLPNTPQWQNLTPEQAVQPYNDGGGTSPLSTNGTLAGISAIISVIQSNDGANIPTLGEAQRLIASVVGLAGGDAQAQRVVEQADSTDASNALSSQFAPSLVLPFRSYFEFADNVVNPDSINEYIVKSLFQYKYIYVASAMYLTVDIVIKTMQNARDRGLRSFRWAMAVRFAFAVLLVLLQVVFTVFEGAPSTAALDGALAICAAVLLAELIAQQALDALRPRLDRPRPAGRGGHKAGRMPFFRIPRRESPNRSASSLDKPSDDQHLEMQTRLAH